MDSERLSMFAIVARQELRMTLPVSAKCLMLHFEHFLDAQFVVA